MDETFYRTLDIAWHQITRLLFCERTNLIYDYLATLDERRFDFLPLPEEIQHGFPNSKGYSTGMEDSMINAGMAMDICILRSRLFPETAQECSDFSRKLLRGMELCATVHGRNGYIVRSVSHRDGKSCYSCSSRDQMTFWVWGLWRCFHSPLASAEEKERIVELLVMLAERCEKEVVSENEYCVLTLDNVPDALNKMDHVLPHESLRLPMFYRTAFALSGEARWKANYDRLIVRSLHKAAEFKNHWNHFELSQFLLTLSLCHALDPRVEFVQLSRNIASIAEKYLCSGYLPPLEQWNRSWAFPAISWKDSRNITLMKQAEGKVIGVDGRLDLRFHQKPVFSALLDLVRIPANLMIGLSLAPEYHISEELAERFRNAFLRPDYSQTYTCSTVNMLYAALLSLHPSGKPENGPTV